MNDTDPRLPLPAFRRAALHEATVAALLRDGQCDETEAAAWADAHIAGAYRIVEEGEQVQ